MTINEFQIGALRTDSPITKELRERLYASEGHLIDLFRYHRGDKDQGGLPQYSADQLKKWIFYGKIPGPEKQFREFHDDTNLLNCPDQFIRVLHGALGILTEVQELGDALMPMLTGQALILDPINVMEEFGDVSWYVAIGSRGAGFDLEEVLVRNQAKLRARYPGKFEEEKAENRDLGEERKALSLNLPDEAQKRCNRAVGHSSNWARGDGACQFCGYAGDSNAR